MKHSSHGSTTRREKSNIYIHRKYVYIPKTHIMTTVTLSVPEDLKKQMDQFRELNWSEIARQAFKQRIQDIEFMRAFTAKSNITEEDALRWGRELNKKLAERYISPRDKKNK